MNQYQGRIIKGYELRNRLGIGGFGAVYRAYQPLVGREVAIKIILPEHADQPEFVRRFESEARLVARLEHPYIVPMFDYWREPGGAYLVMRYLRGGNLRTALDSKGAYDTDSAVRLIEQIAAALAVAHRNNVVHRDIKPDNIMLDEYGNAYLTDFGLATITADMRGPKPVASDSASNEGISGSFAYMSPEQIRSEPITTRTDIYSMGMVIFELMTGKPPYPGATLSEMAVKHLQEPLPDVRELRPELPTALNDVIQQATAKDPMQRYPDMLALAADFRQAFASQSEVSGADMIVFDFSGMDAESVVNPYKGLRPFEEGDAADFFGRETLIEQLIARLAEADPQAHFLAVVGPSGSGKSSVIKAGVLPALHNGTTGALPGSEHWYTAEFVPGIHPLEQLAAALLSVAVTPPGDLLARLRAEPGALLTVINQILPQNTQLLMVIDQFEEVFTLVESEEERAQFLDVLRLAVSDPVGRLRVIVTLRADFYDKPLLYAGFGALMRARTEIVLPLSNEELERAISAPAGRAGLQIEPALLGAIIGDVNDEPGALPLLQYALTEAFERRDGTLLTLQAYVDSGGVLGALARRAEDLYLAMDAGQQSAVRQVFLRLVTLGEGTEDTRRRARLSELTSIGSDPTQTQTALDTFGKYRLLSFDRDSTTREPTVEVAHEALIRKWERLREWLNESRTDVRLQRSLAVAAAEWINSKRDPSFLLQGARLIQFQEWADHASLALNQEETDFLKASSIEHDRLAVEEKRRAAHELQLAQQTAESAKQAAAAQQRAANRLRYLVGVFGIFLIVAVLLSILAFSARSDALQQAQIAQQNAATATNAQGQALVQAQIAQQNAATATNAQGQALVQARIAQQNAATATNAQGQALVQAQIAQQNAATATNAQGQALVQAQIAQQNAATATNAQGQALVQAQIAQQNALTATNAQGQALVQAQIAQQNAATATNAQGQALVQAQIAQQNALTATNAQGQALVQAQIAQQNAATATNAQGQALVQERNAEALSLASAADNVLNSNGNASVAALLSIRSLNTSYTVQGSSALLRASALNFPLHVFSGIESVDSVVFSRDGKRLLVGSRQSNNVRLIDAETGTEIQHYPSDDVINSVAFSPDGKSIVTASDDNTARIWDTQSGREIKRFVHDDAVNSAVFSPDGLSVLTGCADKNAHLWNVQSGAETRTYNDSTQSDIISNALFSPDGKSILVQEKGGLVLIWNTDSDSPLHTFQDESHYGTASIAFSPNGNLIALGSTIGQISLWDTRTYAPIKTIIAHTDLVSSLAFSADSQYLLSGSADQSVHVLDVQSGTTILTLHGHTDNVSAVAFSPDGQRIATGSLDLSLQVWKYEPPAKNVPFSHSDLINTVTYSTDGKYLLTASNDSTARLWEIATHTLLREYKVDQAVFKASFSPDGKYILLGDSSGKVTLWNFGSDSQVRAFTDATDAIYAIAFAPDGQTIAAASLDGNTYLWNVQNGKTLHKLADPQGKQMSAVVFSPDGKTLATGNEMGDLALWDVQTGNLTNHLSGLNFEIGGIAFSPDGRQLVAGGADRVAKIWDVQSGAIRHILSGHTDSINTLVISPDGKYILTGSVDKTARLWDAQTGIEKVRLQASESVSGVSFSPDGSTFVTVGSLKVARFWTVDPTHLITTLCGQLQRDLDQGERSVYNIPDNSLTCPNLKIPPTPPPLGPASHGPPPANTTPLPDASTAETVNAPLRTATKTH